MERVRRVRFNYDTEAWEDGTYYLPVWSGDFVLFTPTDMLTRDDTWISHGDMINGFSRIPAAIPDAQLRAQVSNYFTQHLRSTSEATAGSRGQRRRRRRAPSQKDRREAAMATIRRYPAVIDYYIRLKELTGAEAESLSMEKVQEISDLFVRQVRRAVDDIRAKTNFYELGLSSYDAALERAKAFKHYVENQDGWRVINRAGKQFARETEVQLFFGIIWFGSVFDVNREVNNGRGPVDFKISIGSADKSLIEFKLASNSKLKQNLEKQVEIYEKANQTATSVKVIICYTEAHQTRVADIQNQLGLESREDIIVVDARSDNKPSASVA
jgi:hypothetical protein